MKIVVIADTHLKHYHHFPPDILNSFKSADAVIHLGDFESVEIVEQLKKMPNFHGVAGNHDRGKIKHMLPESDIISVNGKRIGIVHGHGCVLPLGLQYGLIQRFNGEKLDAILFGHTHIAISKNIEGILFFNPGSSVGRFPAEQKSYGIMEVGDTISTRIVPLHIPEPRNILSQAYSMIQMFSS